MRITALVENSSECELKAKHGLSLYIETKNHKIVFDLGSDNTLFDNAKKRGVDLSLVDTVIISHGHRDHGGALKQFLKINHIAKIYLQADAFEPHYFKLLFLKINIGLDRKLATHQQIILLDGDYKIDDELNLFTVKKSDKYYSPANNALHDKHGKDNFLHEQNLIISDEKTALIMGCAHSGVVNIMQRAEMFDPKLCVGGYHLLDPITKKSVSVDLINEIATELQKYTDTQFYTCHCTGKKAFELLSEKMSTLLYLSCGKTIEI